MSALADALVAAQSRAVAALGKQYASGTMDEEALRAALTEIGQNDPADTSQWIAALNIIRATGAAPCRACLSPLLWGSNFGSIEYHHLVPRGQGGDDVADNIIPLHRLCHVAVTNRGPNVLRAVAESLTDSERVYVVGKLGEDGLSRLFGATR